MCHVGCVSLDFGGRLMFIDKSQINGAKNELERRRKILIELAHNQGCPMNKLDRKEILWYLEKNQLPKRPATIPTLMKSFIMSLCIFYLSNIYSPKSLVKQRILAQKTRP